MGSSAPSHVTTTTLNDLPPWLSPYAQSYLTSQFGLAFPNVHLTKKGTYNGQDQYSLEGLDQYPTYGGPLREILGFTPEELAARSKYGDFLGSPLGGDLTAADQQIQDTLSGKYLSPDSNPFLKQTYERAAGEVGKNYRDFTAPGRAAQFALSGALGGTPDLTSQLQSDYGFGQQLSGLATDIYGGNYQQERSRQFEAPQMAGALASLREQLMSGRLQGLLGLAESGRQLSQQQTDVGYENELTKFEYPWKIMQALGDALGISTGRASSSSTTAPNPSAGNDAATYGGLGIAGAAALGQLGRQAGYF